jgi:purine-binding chemotaxis protein CheW
MAQEHLFASFMLDRSTGLEIALRAENVNEATPINGMIQALPACIDFLEGIMHLRDEVIPIINLKKRLGLQEKSYNTTAKVAVVTLLDNRYGLLVDDIKDVFRVESANIRPVNSLLQTEDRIISALISLEKGKRTVELLDLESLFLNGFSAMEKLAPEKISAPDAGLVTYFRYVVFSSAGQEYGVPVEYSQEITFYSNINDMFKSGVVEGALQLRGNTIPVVNARYLLSEEHSSAFQTEETWRILVLFCEGCSLGMIIEEIKEILTIPSNEILPMPTGGDGKVSGVYPRKKGGNIMLLDMENIVGEHLDTIKSLARINKKKEVIDEERLNTIQAHHLITENCYLVFAIEKNFAIEIKDVQEIIENEGAMEIPCATGFATQVINLRGQIVPIVNLRSFYNYSQIETRSEKSKLIICRGEAGIVALEVDRIVTIYKQEQFHTTPSLNPQLEGRRDTLDRLIDFNGHDGISEHVLVVNVDNLIGNHMAMVTEAGFLADNVNTTEYEKVG